MGRAGGHLSCTRSGGRYWLETQGHPVLGKMGTRYVASPLHPFPPSQGTRKGYLYYARKTGNSVYSLPRVPARGTPTIHAKRALAGIVGVPLAANTLEITSQLASSFS